MTKPMWMQESSMCRCPWAPEERCGVRDVLDVIDIREADLDPENPVTARFRVVTQEGDPWVVHIAFSALRQLRERLAEVDIPEASFRDGCLYRDREGGYWLPSREALAAPPGEAMRADAVPIMMKPEEEWDPKRVPFHRLRGVAEYDSRAYSFVQRSDAGFARLWRSEATSLKQVIPHDGDGSEWQLLLELRTVDDRCVRLNLGEWAARALVKALEHLAFERPKGFRPGWVYRTDDGEYWVGINEQCAMLAHDSGTEPQELGIVSYWSELSHPLQEMDPLEFNALQSS